MIHKAIYNNRFLWLLLLYGLIIMIFTLNYNSASSDEAHNILMGQKVVSGQYCYTCKQYTGSAMIEPILASIGDYYGGLHGARVASIFFGLGLTAIIYWIARTLFEGKYGLISSMLFLFSGTSLYLSKLATYDIVSAFFLGLAFLLLLLGEKNQSFLHKCLLLLASASVLFLSAMIKYAVAIFIPPLVLYVFLRNRTLSARLFFSLPLVICISLYVYFAIYPVGEILSESITSLYDHEQVSFRTLTDWTFRWIAMPYLLTIFGMFHEEKGKIAIVLFFLSTPIILLHLVTGVEQSVNRDVIFSHIFLAPAAALGVNRLGDIFSLRSPNLWVKPFFIAAILVVLWVFGFQELKWLERQYPNITPVIDFFKKKGFDGMNVTIDSNYGVAVYAYSLGTYYPRARFMSIAELDSVDNAGRPLYEKNNFIVFDGYYGKKNLRDRALYYLQDNYFLMENIKLPVSWGVTDIKIFGRRGT